jgi:hypothetical protein
MMEEKYRYLVTVLFEYDSDGKTKKETESWLINAVSVSDAETKANKEIEKIAKGVAASAVMECRIKEVKETKITKVME